MTSQNFPKIPPSSLSAVPTQTATKDSERVGISAEPTNFEELEEFRPDVDGKPKARLNKPSRPWLAGSRGVLIGIGVGAVLTFGALKLATSANTTKPAATDTAVTAIAQSVTVAPVERAMVTDTFTANGTVTADNLLPIAAATSGLKIQQVLVREGDQVAAGQPMAILDNSVLQAQLTQSQATYQAAQSVVQQKQAQLTQAEAQLSQAQSNANRYEQLAAKGAVSRQDLETQETNAATARAAVSVAQADIENAKSDALSKKAQIQQLQTQIGQTQVVAPASGLVAEKLAEVGDVTGNSKLFSIIQNGALELDALVPADQLPSVKIGAPVQVSSESNSQIQLQGTVREIAPLVDAQTRQATVKIDLPTSDQLRPGLYLKAAIATQTVPGLTVPTKAVLPQSDGSATVYVLAGNKAQAKTVQVGAIQPGGNLMAIKSGLNAGDRVIVSGAGYLKDGDSVTVVSDTADTLGNSNSPITAPNAAPNANSPANK